MERTARLFILMTSFTGLLLSGSLASAQESTAKLPEQPAQTTPVTPETPAATTAPAAPTAAGDLATSATPNPEKPVEEKPEKPWRLALGLGRSNSLYVTGDGEDQASWDFSMAPSFTLNSDYKLSFLVEYTQDIKASDTDYGRGNISVSKSSGFEGFNHRVKLVPRFGVGLPLSETTRASSLNASTALGGKLEANPDYLITKKLALSLDVSVTRYFHKYDTATSGAINNQWASAQTGEIGWSFTDDLSFSVTAGHYNFVSYQGGQTDFLSHSEELGYKVSPKWSVAVGHAFGAPYVSARRANGRDINFEPTDEKNSLVYAQLNLTL